MDNARIWAPGSAFALSQKMMTTRASGFGAMLRTMRDANGLSQGEMAMRCGIERSMYSRLESGARKPGLATLVRLFDGLDCTDADRIRLLNAAADAELISDDAL